MIGKQHKLLPFLNDIRKNRVSIGKKMETNKLKKIANKLGIRVTTKRQGPSNDSAIKIFMNVIFFCLLIL